MTETESIFTLPYTADITRADVDALDAFMTARLHELRLAHRNDPEVCRVTHGLGAAINRQLFELRRDFADDGTAEALEARMGHWNELCRLTAGWRDTEGYDVDRWQQVAFREARQAAEAKNHSDWWEAQQAADAVVADERARRAHP
ncbi:hypothetical protein [Streptomyces sp. YIM 121038]|uniref:hypothetical protein n=1 Tax=Streptomyces sp. YIM 121038 TaxID=2136401 RepID=UPI001110AA25|nr:hypothetical protein [Streptomyces sp. YIM 121038]